MMMRIRGPKLQDFDFDKALNIGIKAKKDGTKRLKSGLYTSSTPKSRSYEQDTCQTSTTFVVTIDKCCLSVRPA